MNVKEKLQALLTASNATTGETDTTLTDAVNNLIDGYGSGGGGGGSVPPLSKGVNFIDYDGTVVATWETSTVAGKTTLPANPTHAGLTAQGWNWTLAEIKNYIADQPDSLVVVGQMYTTADGKTRIYIHLEEGRLSPYLSINVDGSVDIDWGDGSTHDTVTGSSAVVDTQHIYPHGGDYVISLTVTGTVKLFGTSATGSMLLWLNSNISSESNLNRVYQTAIQRVEIGDNTTLDQYAFYYCYSLTSVTIPNSITDLRGSAFYYCYSLTSVTIPNSVTNLGSYTFQNCYSLASVAIPNNITTISSSVFHSCYSLASVTIPSSVTTLGSSVFNNCYSLTHITIPNNVTKLNSTFNNCYCLMNVTIPNSMVTIGSNAFSNCYGLGLIKFTRRTPPTVSSSTAWSNIPIDCIIYVPTGTKSAYTAATNYPSSTKYRYREY